MEDPNKFYTYAYLRVDKTPYYIGKGEGNRAYKKNRGEIKPPKDQSRILFLKENLSEEEAFEHEKYMIAVFGRKDLGTGILHNRTNGGEGVSGIVVSQELRRKRSQIMKGKNNPRYGKPPTKGMLGKKHTEEAKQKLREGREVKYFSVISPTGEVIHSKNAKQFCRDNNLDKGHFSQVLNGKRPVHKGFRLYTG